jgi:Flp pilus assembly CpaF family ATPase
MTELTLKRVKDLDVDDVLIYSGVRVKVGAMNEFEISFDSVDEIGYIVNSNVLKLGRRSRQFVEYIKNEPREKWSRKRKPMQ